LRIPSRRLPLLLPLQIDHHHVLLQPHRLKRREGLADAVQLSIAHEYLRRPTPITIPEHARSVILRGNNDDGLIANPPTDSIIFVVIASSFPSLMCSIDKRSDARTSNHKWEDTPDVPDNWQDGERQGFSTRIAKAKKQLHPIPRDNVVGGGHFNVWGEKGRGRPRRSK
jgi:hypothetical protein